MASIKCYVCGKEYTVCKSIRDSKMNPWRKTACCIEHFQIRQVYMQYRDGAINKVVAREMLEHIGVTSGKGLKQGYHEFFEEIFKEDPIPVEEVQAEVEEDNSTLYAEVKKKSKK